MAGTDKTAGRAEDGPVELDGPAMVLAQPQLGENIGAACRAMWNFGFSDLRLAAPRDGWPNPAAEAMASGADRVLQAARVYPDVVSATAALAHVYATTARPRELTKRVLTPREASAEIVSRHAAGERCGVLFGPERTGLENADVIRANAIIAVPANLAFASLNLAQCVLLMSYELRQAEMARRGEGREPMEEPMEEPMGERMGAGAAQHDAPATMAEVEGVAAHLIDQLDEAGHFWPEAKRPAMVASLRNFLSRAAMTGQDARMLRGVVRALSEKRRRRP
ncbi:MAG: RNA methyltransferase [Pseudomonadota bacterium]